MRKRAATILSLTSIPTGGWSDKPRIIATVVTLGSALLLLFGCGSKNDARSAELTVDSCVQRYQAADANRQLEVAFDLSRTKSGRAALVKLLADQSSSDRWILASFVGGLSSPEAKSALIEHLTDSDPGVRSELVRLVQLDLDQRAEDQLSKLMTLGSSRDAVAAIDALRRLRRPSAYEIVARQIGSKSSALRETAAWALGDWNSKTSRASLASLFTDPDPWVRHSAMSSFVRTEPSCKEAERVTFALSQFIHSRKTASDRTGAIALLCRTRCSQATTMVAAILAEQRSDLAEILHYAADLPPNIALEKEVRRLCRAADLNVARNAISLAGILKLKGCLGVIRSQVGRSGGIDWACAFAMRQFGLGNALLPLLRGAPASASEAMIANPVGDNEAFLKVRAQLERASTQAYPPRRAYVAYVARQTDNPWAKNMLALLKEDPFREVTLVANFGMLLKTGEPYEEEIAFLRLYSNLSDGRDRR